jgi:hypothetical protein
LPNICPRWIWDNFLSIIYFFLWCWCKVWIHERKLCSKILGRLMITFISSFHAAYLLPTDHIVRPHFWNIHHLGCAFSDVCGNC